MKKIATTFLLLGAFLSSANADVTRVEAGLGLWSQDSSGKLSYSDYGANGRYNSSEPNESSMYFWASIKHPVPIIPNLRLEYATVEDSGVGFGRFKDFNIVGAPTKMDYKMKQYDIIPYYNILDNTAWTTLDLGVDVKIVEASLEASPNGLGFNGYKKKETFALPLLYLRARVEIPATNVGFESDVKYVSYRSDSVYDIRVKVDYTFNISPAVQPAIEFGYRIQNIDVDEVNNLDAELKFSGFFGGLMLRF